MTVSIKEFDDILETEQTAQTNATMLRAYEESKCLCKKLLDFDSVIWNDDINPIVDTCRKLGIKEFTISVHQGNILDVLAEFQKLGVSVQCITEIEAHTERRDWYENAFLMKVEDTFTPAQLWSNAIDAVYLADEAFHKAILHYDNKQELTAQELTALQQLEAMSIDCSRLIRVLEE